MDKLYYFLEANLAFAMLYGIYWLTLSRGNLLKGRRTFLLAMLPLAVLLPNLDFSVLPLPQAAELITLDVMLGEVVVGVSQQGWMPNYPFIFWTVYLSVSLLILVRVAISVFTLSQKLNKLPGEPYRGIRLVFDDTARLPYSFFHTIFIQRAHRHKTAMLQHEMAHARQLHSADRIVAELLFALLWINPVVYLWRKSLEEVHEYLADSEVLRSGELPETYTKGLVEAAFQHQGLHMASCFNKQFTKKRIIMIQNNSKRIPSRIGLMTVLMAALAFAFACDKSDIEDEKQGVIIIEQTQELKAEDKAGIQKSTAKQAYESVEQMPEYPGGHMGLLQFIAKNVKYPAAARKAGIQERIFTRFIVDENGTAKDFTIVKGDNVDLQNAALEVLKQMDTWTPGYENGKAVPVYFTVPINFKLQ